MNKIVFVEVEIHSTGHARVNIFGSVTNDVPVFFAPWVQLYFIGTNMHMYVMLQTGHFLSYILTIFFRLSLIYPVCFMKLD